MSTQDKPRKSRVGLIIILILIVVAIIVVIINPFENLAQLLPGQGEEAVAVAEEDSTLSIRVREVEEANLRAYIKANGNVVDTKTVDVYPEVAGKLTYFDVKVGDKVTVDQEFARIDPSRPGMNFRETVVKAPVDGTVLAVNFAYGASVSPQAALIRIGMLDSLEVEVAIAERHIGQIGIGTEAEAEFKAFPGKKFYGKIERMSPVLDPVTRTLEIGITLEDPQNMVKPGMFPSVLIYTERVENALVIDRSSILYDGNQAFVYVVDDGNVARRTDITLGLVVDENAEVIGGLELGDEVVVQGQTLVTDGTSVRIVD